jgi:hypothetical protein
MKKALVLLVFLTGCFTVTAQESKLIIGVEAAAIRTLPWGEDVSDAEKPQYNISPGLNLEYLLNKNFSIKAGVLYERKGWTTCFASSTPDRTQIWLTEEVANFDYLTIPLLFSYSTNGVVRFYINGGGYLGFLLSNNTIVSAYGNYPEHVQSEYTHDVSEDTKTLDFGFSFGCGLFVPMGERYAFDFGLRDNLGMVDWFKPEYEWNSRFNSIGIVASLKYYL